MEKITRFFTWSEFDKSVDNIANKCKLLEISGIYGIPRGGLCLSVALSHKLNLKLINKPSKNCLIVDDVYETGTTLNTFKDIEGASFFVLFSKKRPLWWNTLYLSQEKEWIVFPWENKEIFFYDMKEYISKRGLN